MQTTHHYKILALPLFLFLCMVSVHAAYNSYCADSGNTCFTNGYSISNVAEESIGSGSYTQPLINDLDVLNGNEIYNIGTDGILRVINGRTRTQIDSINVGTPVINPVICNINNNVNGIQQYIGIFNNGTSNNLVALELSETNSKLQTIAIQPVNEVTNDTTHVGNLACGKLYLGDNDNTNYVAWVNRTKSVFIAKITETPLIEYNFGVLPTYSITGFTQHWSVLYSTFSEVNNELPYDNLAYGNNHVTISNTLDPTPNYGTVSFTAGRKVFVFSPSRATLINNGLYSVDAYSTFINMTWLGVTLSTPATSSQELYGEAFTGAGSGSVLLTTRTSTAAIPYLVIGMHSGIFGTADLTIDGNFTVLASGGFGNKRQTATSIVPYLNDASRAFIMSMGINAGVEGSFHIVNLGNLQTEHDVQTLQTTYPAFVNSRVSTEISSPFRIFTGQFETGGDADVLFMGGGAGTTNHPMYLLPYSTNWTPQIIFNITAPINAVDTPVPDRLTRDNYEDFVYSNPSKASAIVSQLAGVGEATNLPFTVRVTNSSFDPISNTKTITDTVVTNFSGNTVNYAVTCNIASTVYYSDSFTPSLIQYPLSYNNYTLFTDNVQGGNVSDYLTNNGLRFSINGDNSTYFDLLRATGVDYNGVLTVGLHVKTTNDIIIDVPITTLSGLLTDYIRVNKTGTDVYFSRITNSIPTSLGNGSTTVISQYGTLPSDEMFVQLNYNPRVNSITGQKYFDTFIKMNYVTVTGSTGSTVNFAGSTISQTEIFTQTQSNFTLKSVSLTSDPTNDQPQFTTFYKTDTPQTVDAGTYTVEAGANGGNTFTSTCTYTSSGTYVQRHYIGGNTTDYTNYRTVTVLVSDFATANRQEAIVTGNASYVNANTATDSFSTGLAGLMDSLGMTSVGGKFTFWLILMIIVSIALFMTNVYLGIVGIVGMILLGVVLGMLPLWVVLIMVIICAAIFVAAFNVIRGV